MIEFRSSFDAVDLRALAEDPAGGVMIPPGQRAVIRSQVLGGRVTGSSIMMKTIDTSWTSSTHTI